MSRKAGLFCSALFIFGVVLYLAYDTAQEHTVSSFIYSYLSDFQKYLYLMSFYVLPILYFTKIPYMQGEFKIRYGKNLVSIILGTMIRNSFITACYIFVVHIVSAALFGFGIDIQLRTFYPFMVLYLFIAACSMIYHMVYIIFNKEVLAILCVFAANIFYLAIMLALQFYVFPPTTDENIWMLMFHGYVVVVNIAGVSIVTVYLPRKECLQ